MGHGESYKVGERGVVMKATEGSSVVEVRLEGDYHIVESVLPLLRRPVSTRTVHASLLHLRKEGRMDVTQLFPELPPADKTTMPVLPEPVADSGPVTPDPCRPA